MFPRRVRGLLLIMIVLASAVVAVAAVQLLAWHALPSPSHRSAVLDGLSSDYPDPQLISSLVHVLESAGFSVDVYDGSEITVDLYRVLATKGYQFVLFRVHSAFQDGQAWLFTSEVYSKEKLLTRYGAELFSNQIAPARTFLGGEMVLAVGPEFIRRSSLGNWMGAVIVLAGCYGTAGGNLPQAFVERGASAVIGWNGLVSANHADRASLTLMRLLLKEKMTVGDAVEETMLQVGEDPGFHTSLTSYPADRFPDQDLWIATDPILREEYGTVPTLCREALSHPQPLSAGVPQDADVIFE